MTDIWTVLRTGDREQILKATYTIGVEKAKTNSSGVSHSILGRLPVEVAARTVKKKTKEAKQWGKKDRRKATKLL